MKEHEGDTKGTKVKYLLILFTKVCVIPACGLRIKKVDLRIKELLDRQMPGSVG